MKRREEAYSAQNRANPYLLSFIIDIMDQAHCTIPSLGTQNSFKDPLKQMITGVKEHGFGVHLFATIDTVHKGANLTIFLIDSVIEKWKKRHGYYPTKIYCQLDGGKENANQYVLHHLEHLVTKRIAREIIFTRLPTGHTHDDVDACFAVVWKCWLRFRNIDTFKQFKQGIEDAFFNEDGTKCIVHDWTLVIPDYIKFYTPVLDKNLSSLHSGIATMHQWKFEAVEPSTWFPLGAKTLYRAYSSSQVVVFEKKHPEECLSPIGLATGLEPITLFLTWRPDIKDDPNRPGIEGFYLLRGMPHEATGSITPADFPDKCHDSIASCLNQINKHYCTDRDILKTWSDWAAIYAPTNSDAVDYVRTLNLKRKPYYIPLRALLLDAGVHIVSPKWMQQTPLEQCPRSLPLFEWPEVLAAAMNSVAHDMNLNPPPPRLYLPSDVNLLQERTSFLNKVDEPYYTVFIPTTTADYIKKLLKRKVGYKGEFPSLLGNKKFQLLYHDIYAIYFIYMLINL